MITRQLAALAAPFPPDAVSWRVGSISKDKSKGMALAYIDARDVQDRLDEVMGADWQDELSVQPNGLVTCRIGLLIDGTWRWRMDSTAALPPSSSEAEDAKAEQAREMAQKGAASDAFKRAAVKWGIGRYLYSLPSPWVAVNQWKQIEDVERPKLRAVLARHAVEAATHESTGDIQRIEDALRAAATLADLAEAWKRAQPAVARLPDSWQQRLTKMKDECKAALLRPPALQAAE